MVLWALNLLKEFFMKSLNTADVIALSVVVVGGLN